MAEVMCRVMVAMRHGGDKIGVGVIGQYADDQVDGEVLLAEQLLVAEALRMTNGNFELIAVISDESQLDAYHAVTKGYKLTVLEEIPRVARYVEKKKKKESRQKAS